MNRPAPDCVFVEVVRLIFYLLFVFGIACGSSLASAPVEQQNELIGIAWLPADSFRLGPVSGQYIDSGNGNIPANPMPRATGQPVQGFSAVLAQGDGSFLILADNGYGSKRNSADFVLTLYRIRPDFKTVEGGSGSIKLESIVELSDPFRHAPFKRVAEYQHYPAAEQGHPVEPVIRNYALLTGADFDPESVQQMADDSFWMGDEFGPWLLHFDRVGRLMRPPVAVPGIISPDNEQHPGQTPLAVQSGGFEGLAFDREKNILYPMLEQPLNDGGRHLNIYAFDPVNGVFLPQNLPAPVMRYPLDEGALAVGAFRFLGNDEFLTVERDDKQGPDARINRIYRFKQGDVDEDGFLRKELLVDLLDIRDPHRLAGRAVQTEDDRFRFAFRTVESLVVLGPDTLAVVNDNNYPFGTGPYTGPGKAPENTPEETVFIVLKVPALKQGMASD